MENQVSIIIGSKNLKNDIMTSNSQITLYTKDYLNAPEIKEKLNQVIVDFFAEVDKTGKMPNLVIDSSKKKSKEDDK